MRFDKFWLNLESSLACHCANKVALLLRWCTPLSKVVEPSEMFIFQSTTDKKLENRRSFFLPKVLALKKEQFQETWGLRYIFHTCSLRDESNKETIFSVLKPIFTTGCMCRQIWNSGRWKVLLKLNFSLWKCKGTRQAPDWVTTTPVENLALGSKMKRTFLER